MADGLVIIPTYNEKENIEKLIRKIFSLEKDFHILVVDDGSPDGTGGIVNGMLTEFSGRLHIEERTGKLGLGTAYIHGFKWALNHDYQYIFEMDADFSHNPVDLERLHEACSTGGVDLAIGSRYIKGVNVVNWPMGRVLLSYTASMYVRFITRMDIQDTTAGFKCYRRTVLETIDLDNIKFMGYAFQIEMKFTSYKLGFKLKEVPIIFTDRQEGESKMSSNIIKEALFGVIQMKWNSFFN
ncbi:MAG TPA: polyprenol monophosphomannose synthase [Flavobacteriales bacterium]|nr:polyprenol monophosphomannose synthase [Flavobacteriales bacterium]HIO67387.1 polyprenol monophosphomannose synthase [Flavobacteriales bacterium]